MLTQCSTMLPKFEMQTGTNHICVLFILVPLLQQLQIMHSNYSPKEYACTKFSENCKSPTYATKYQMLPLGLPLFLVWHDFGLYNDNIPLIYNIETVNFILDKRIDKIWQRSMYIPIILSYILYSVQ